VKAKLGEGFGDPGEMVTREKRRRLRQAAETWAAAHPELAELEMRFDVVTVTGRSLRRLTAAFVLALVVAGLFAVAADARRRATRGERTAIAAAVKRKHPGAPARCFPLSILVSTVNGNYASATYKKDGICRIEVGNGTFVLRRVRRGVWRILSEGSEHRCREAPRGVVRDLLGACL
jgi:hypothetical protein